MLHALEIKSFLFLFPFFFLRFELLTRENKKATQEEENQQHQHVMVCTKFGMVLLYLVL